MNALFYEALTVRDYLWREIDLRSPFAAVRYDVKDEEKPTWGRPLDRIFLTGPSRVLPAKTPARVIVDELRRFRPSVLLCYPNLLVELIRLCRAAGERIDGLSAVQTIGESLHDETRELAREVLDVAVWDLYSSNEVGVIACECPDGRCCHGGPDGDGQRGVGAPSRCTGRPDPLAEERGLRLGGLGEEDMEAGRPDPGDTVGLPGDRADEGAHPRRDPVHGSSIGRDQFDDEHGRRPGVAGDAGVLPVEGGFPVGPRVERQRGPRPTQRAGAEVQRARPTLADRPVEERLDTLAGPLVVMVDREGEPRSPSGAPMPRAAASGRIGSVSGVAHGAPVYGPATLAVGQTLTASGARWCRADGA